MKPRITFSREAHGTLEIWINEAGRDQLVRELQQLDRTNDHFHLGPEDMFEVDLGSVAYNPADTVFEYGKIMLRPDEWDELYYPHVMPNADSTGSD